MQNIKKINVLIIGYGSIGERHARILSKGKFVKQIFIFSKRQDHAYNQINSLSKKTLNKIDYIIISNPTSKHYKILKILNRLVKGKKIMVEKPLFEKYYKPLNLRNNVYVGYNMRFDPMIQFLKKNFFKKKALKINIMSKSNLKKWRKNINYSKSDSAKRIGGGVLMDYSHELDFITWIFGKFMPSFKLHTKISKLKIKSKDFLVFIGKIKKTIISGEFNYFSNIASREINIDFVDSSIKADLLHKYITISKKNNIKKITFKNCNRDTTYFEMHKNIILKKGSNTCSYIEGLRTMKTIKNLSN